MKKPIFIIVISITGIVLLFFAGYFTGYIAIKAVATEKFAKATLLRPTEEWISLYGDNLDSYQTFNINLLVNEVRKKQAEQINLDKSRPFEERNK